MIMPRLLCSVYKTKHFIEFFTLIDLLWLVTGEVAVTNHRNQSSKLYFGFSCRILCACTLVVMDVNVIKNIKNAGW